MKSITNHKALPVAVATLAILLTASVFTVSAQESDLQSTQDSANYEQMKENRGAMKSAVEAEDYDAFVDALSQLPKAEESLENATEENFAKMIEAHQLMEAGDKEGAKVIMEELGFGKGFHNGHRGEKFGQIRGQLNEDQMVELKALKQSFEGSDLTQEEKRVQVEALLKEFGVEMPEHPILSQLDESQKEELKTMKEAGVDREEIKAYLEGEGIELPEKPERLELTDEQKAALEEIKNDDALDFEAKREAVEAYMETQGLEMPTRGQIQKHRFAENLSDEQKEQIKELKESGLSREEIRGEMGLEKPERPSGQNRGR